MKRSLNRHVILISFPAQANVVSLLILAFSQLCALEILAQNTTETQVSIRGHQALAPLNFDTRSFSNWGDRITAVFENELKGEQQAFDILLLAQFDPNEDVQYTLHTRPAINQNAVSFDDLLARCYRVKPPRPKYSSVSIAILVQINGGFTDAQIGFTPRVPTIFERKKQQLQRLSLEHQYLAIKNFAVQQFLPLLAESYSRMDPQYQAIRSFGTNLSFVDQGITRTDVVELTNSSSTYWRALMQAEKGDPIVQLAKIGLHLAAGDFDRANRLLSLTLPFAQPSSLPEHLLKTINWRLDIFYRELNKSVEEGITLEDQGDYQQAIDHFKQLKSVYPYSAWLNFEHFYTLNNQQIELEASNAARFELWDSLSAEVFRYDPYYPAEVAVRTADEAFNLYLRKSANALFQDQKRLLTDIVSFADYALDLEDYALAAHLYWQLILEGMKREDGDRFTPEFLYCLKQLEMDYLVNQFDAEQVSDAEQIPSERQTIKEQNEYYRVFK